MSDTPTMLQDRLASMVHAFSDEERKYAVRLLAADVGKLERELNAANKEKKRLREWIGSLEELEVNNTDRRKWATPSTWLPAGLKIYLGGNQP